MKRILISLFALVLSLAGTSAHAGLKTTVPLYMGSGYFGGVPMDVRLDGSGSSYLVCFTAYTPAGPTATCYARDASGHTDFCDTDIPGLVTVIQSISQNSQVVVSHSSHRCYQIQVILSSQYVY